MGSGEGEAVRGGETPVFSVVIPVFNGERFLPEAIRSALSQSLPPLEVLVVDDGSTDGTRAVAEGFGEPVRVLAQPNAGPSAARNRGARAARGEWVAFLDSDDRWEPGYLRAAAAYLARQPRVGLLCTGVRVLAEDGTPTPHVILKESPGAAYSTTGMLEKDVGTILPPMVRRDLFLASGGFDETLRANEDCHLWLRLSLVTEVHQIPEPLLLYRRHGANASGNLLENARESLRSLDLLERDHREFREAYRRPMRKLRGKESLRLGRELLVRSRGEAGDVAQARRALVAAVTCRPGRLRGWAYLALAWVPGGPAAFARWRALELELKGRLSGTPLAARFRGLRRRVRGSGGAG